MTRNNYAAAALLLASLTACENAKEQPTPTPAAGEVRLHFENTVGSNALKLQTNYTTAAGDAFRVTELQYYISNLKLTRADGSTWAQPESYYLINHADAASQRLKLADVPAGEYTKLTFTIGVDSARNTAGAQTGPLDPVRGMFWSWSQGYVFLRLIGNSPQAPSNVFAYDVAGFRWPHNTIRTVTLPMPGGKPLRVRAEHSPEMHLQANVLKVFEGPKTVRIATTHDVAGGAAAMELANNYAAGMFAIDHVHE